MILWSDLLNAMIPERLCDPSGDPCDVMGDFHHSKVSDTRVDVS